MPDRRKSKDELRKEALGDTSPDKGGNTRESFEAVSEEERSQINKLFVQLNKMGWETVGSYQIGTDGPDSPKIVTLSAVVPSTNDWDPSEVYDG